MRFSTADGGTVQVTRYACRVEMHLRAPDGRTVASVDMDYRDAEDLIDELCNIIDN